MTDDNISILFVMDLHIILGTQEIEAVTDVPLWEVAGGCLRQMKGSNGMDALAKRLHYYQFNHGTFLDAKKTLGEQRVRSGAIIIASFENNVEKLERLIEMKEETALDKAAWDIRHGK